MKGASRALRILIAPDSFKECASALAVAEAIARGVRAAVPDARIDLCPLADGGEGSLQVLSAAGDGVRYRQTVLNAVGEPVAAEWALMPDGTAVVELAQAAGLEGVPLARRDPWHSSTRGLGQLLAAVLNHAVSTGFADSVRRVALFVGGSATHDAGAGMLQALGVRLLDADGNEVGPGARGVSRVRRIDASGLDPRWRQLPVVVATDVDAPLCGPDGAAWRFARQKGALEADIAELDRITAAFAAQCEQAWPESGTVNGDSPDAHAVAPTLGGGSDAPLRAASRGGGARYLPGSGAAGGTAFAVMMALGANVRSGFDVVAGQLDLARRIAECDLVLTGEGALDAQTAGGKVPAGVIRLAQTSGTPVIALAGSLRPGYEVLYDRGLVAAFGLVPGPMSLQDALAMAPERLAAVAADAIRVFVAGR